MQYLKLFDTCPLPLGVYKPLVLVHVLVKMNKLQSNTAHVTVLLYSPPQLSAKDVSLFEERIRRSGTKPPSVQTQGEPPKSVTPVEQAPSPVPNEPSGKPPSTGAKQAAKGGKATK